MGDNEVSRKNSGSKLGASAAGAGGGTLLVLLAQNLPERHPWKSWLVLSAPSTAIFLSAIWLWLRRKIEAHANHIAVEKLIQQAKQTLELGIQNPLTSPQHRDTLRKEYEQLELLQVKGYANRIQVLTHDVSEK